ncbi:MAG: hypothetical protein Q8Q35_00395 [Nanoarchaeota archaeon]|nr:hypothetical protein [Nanoarchaeota archaeon]
MELTKEKIVLPLIFLLAFIFKLIFIFRVPFFSSDESYFNLRHSEFITNLFLPIINDPLSYGGNIITDVHVFHYFLAIWDLFLPQWFVYKILPALLASSIVIMVYILAKEITKNEYASLFAAFLSAFIPIYIGNTLNQISTTSLVIPVFLILVYSLIKIRKRKGLFLIFSLILILLEPLNLLMFFTFFIFIILMIAESKEIRRDEKEAIGFHLMLFILVNLILFKNLYLNKGFAAVWQNVPLELYGNIFQNFNLFDTITLIGVIPLILGLLGFILYPMRDRHMILLGGILMADFTLLLLKLIPFKQGVLLLAVVFCITSAITMSRIIEYLDLTKIARFRRIIVTILVIFTAISLIYPSTIVAREVINDGVHAEEVEALTWIKDNTPMDSTIAGNVYEGNMIAYIAGRANIIDTQFINAEDRLFDVQIIFTTQSLVKATRALNKFSADYIYFSKKTQEMYGVEKLAYTKDESCFENVFENEEATVYKLVC